MGFRNEISPRQGLLRVREFTMAEIEHFVDPLNKNHPKFESVSNMKIPLYSAEDQENNKKWASTEMTAGEALKQNVIKNETMAYFLCRTYLFLTEVGIRPEAIRFRQHRSNEMAHYANDCWDAEVETSYGWIEIAGHADRSAFDLTKHMQKTKVELMAARQLKNPITVTQTVVTLNKQVCGKEFKKDQTIITTYIEDLSAEDKKNLAEKFAADKQITITVDGKEFVLNANHISFSEQTKNVMEEKYIPHVIEPSFGIGRILYCIFEHCFKMREHDAQRTYFAFPPSIAPLKCSLLPLMNNAEMNKKVQEIKKTLIKNGVTSKVDDSGVTVGKRYARTDECGIPFAITVDFDTLKDETVTIRDLDSMKQVRLPISEVAHNINSMTNGLLKWEQVVEKYGLFESAAKDDE